MDTEGLSDTLLFLRRVAPLMAECKYCGESFESESERDAHLEAEHLEELGRIDRRRLGLVESGSSGDDGALGIVVIAAVIVLALLALGGVLYLQAGDSERRGQTGDGPHDLWGEHYHGTAEVVIAGEELDFSRSEFQLQADAFHYEDGDGSTWHVHAKGVTLEYAMGTLGIEVTASSVTYEGETYRDGDPGTSVTVTVNGDAVDPSEYVLAEGDHIRIVVETG